MDIKLLQEWEGNANQIPSHASPSSEEDQTSSEASHRTGTIAMFIAPQTAVAALLF